MAALILRISWFHRKVEDSNLGIPSWEFFLKIDLQQLILAEVYELNGFDGFELFIKLSPVTFRKSSFCTSMFLKNLIKKVVVLNNGFDIHYSIQYVGFNVQRLICWIARAFSESEMALKCVRGKNVINLTDVMKFCLKVAGILKITLYHLMMK